MAETVNVPGAGPVKKGYVAAGIAVLAVILGVAYYRHSKSKAAASAAAVTAAQPDPNAIDPATGLTYGEEAAGIQAGDLAGGGGAFGDTSGIVGYSAQGQPVYADQVGYGPTPSFVSNGAWSQAVQQYLVASTGADAGTVAAALGAYLAGQPLTDAQATIVQSAIAFYGQPPQAGSDGYPPSLKMSGASGATGGTTGSGGAGDSGTGATGTTIPPVPAGGTSGKLPPTPADLEFARKTGSFTMPNMIGVQYRGAYLGGLRDLINATINSPQTGWIADDVEYPGPGGGVVTSQSPPAGTLVRSHYAAGAAYGDAAAANAAIKLVL